MQYTGARSPVPMSGLEYTPKLEIMEADPCEEQIGWNLPEDVRRAPYCGGIVELFPV